MAFLHAMNLPHSGPNISSQNHLILDLWCLCCSASSFSTPRLVRCSTLSLPLIDDYQRQGNIICCLVWRTNAGRTSRDAYLRIVADVVEALDSRIGIISEAGS